MDSGKDRTSSREDSITPTISDRALFGTPTTHPLKPCTKPIIPRQVEIPASVSCTCDWASMISSFELDKGV